MSLADKTVVVVVVTYNSERLLDDLLASLTDGLKGVTWHLRVADNASSDGTADAAAPGACRDDHRNRA
jgi:N-acetylglucosaminyl-diphospho-decaprenol L-rhamnosyltransferase